MSDQSKHRKRWLNRRIHDQTYYNRVVKRVNCTLSNEEYRELCRYAKDAGYKPTVYLKQAAFTYMKQNYLVPVQVETKLHKFVVIVRNIGRNINALALRANRTLKVREVDFRSLEKLVYHLEDQVKLFIRNPEKRDADILDESERRKL
jgi:hypothetical protein